MLMAAVGVDLLIERLSARRNRGEAKSAASAA
jgi:hypothetical protein